MSRLIRFRALDENGRWQYSHDPDEQSFWYGLSDGQLNCETLGQYTGPKDSKGQDIFEGDIVEYPSDTPSVHQHNPHFDRSVVTYEVDDYSMEAKWFVRGDYATAETIRVIGNIHQNPELLA